MQKKSKRLQNAWLQDPKNEYWNVPVIASSREKNSYHDKLVEQPAQQELLTKVYTEKTQSFIKQSHAEGKPFFAFVSQTMPHVPLFVSDEFRGKTAAGICGDVLAELDWSTGEIVRTLKELDIYDNTDRNL